MQYLKSRLRQLLVSDYIRRVLHAAWQAAGGVLLAGLLAARSSADVKLALAAAFTVSLSAAKNYILSRR